MLIILMELDIRLSELINDKEYISNETKLFFQNNHSLDNYISTFEKEINSSSFYYRILIKKYLKSH